MTARAIVAGLLPAALLSGCCSWCACCQGDGACIDFNDLAQGTTYPIGSAFTSAGINMNVSALNPGVGGEVEVTNGANTTGSGNDIRPNNSIVSLTLPPSTNGATFQFADFGGDNELRVNGVTLTGPGQNRMIDFDGASLGGATVAVSASQSGNNWTGSVAITGPINALSIGGQELWIDDLCYE